MDYLRQCYRVRCRLFKDDPTEYWIRWYKAPANAKQYVALSRFRSGVWVNNPEAAEWTGPGEVEGTRQHLRTWTLRGASGQCYRGPASGYAQGFDHSILTNPPADPCLCQTQVHTLSLNLRVRSRVSCSVKGHVRLNLRVRSRADLAPHFSGRAILNLRVRSRFTVSVSLTGRAHLRLRVKHQEPAHWYATGRAHLGLRIHSSASFRDHTKRTGHARLALLVTSSAVLGPPEGALLFTGTETITGSSTPVAEGALLFTGTETITGSSTPVAEGALLFTGTEIITGSSAPVAEGALLFTGTETVSSLELTPPATGDLAIDGEVSELGLEGVVGDLAIDGSELDDWIQLETSTGDLAIDGSELDDWIQLETSTGDLAIDGSENDTGTVTPGNTCATAGVLTLPAHVTDATPAMGNHWWVVAVTAGVQVHVRVNSLVNGGSVNVSHGSSCAGSFPLWTYFAAGCNSYTPLVDENLYIQGQGSLFGDMNIDFDVATGAC